MKGLALVFFVQREVAVGVSYDEEKRHPSRSFGVMATAGSRYLL